MHVGKGELGNYCIKGTSTAEVVVHMCISLQSQLDYGGRSQYMHAN